MMKFGSTILVTIVAGVLGATGCKSSDKSESTASASTAKQGICDKPKLNSCEEYSNEAFAAGEDLLKTGCSVAGGTYSATNKCPAGELGVCKQGAGISSKYYKGAPNDMKPKDAKEKCALYNGTWTGVPVPPSGPLMCDMRKKGDLLQRCKSYTQQNVDTMGGEDGLRERCVKNDGTLSKGSCPSDGVVATCDEKDDGITTYYKPTTKADAKDFCGIAQGTLSMK